MLGTSWRDDPTRVWRFRLSRLCIEDECSHDGITVRRRSSCCYEVWHGATHTGTVMRHTHDSALHAVIQAVVSANVPMQEHERCKVKGCSNPRRVDTNYWLCDEHMRLYWREQKADRRTGKRRRPLDETLVREIRQLLAVGTSKEEMARRFGVSVSTLYKIEQRRVWGWVA